MLCSFNRFILCILVLTSVCIPFSASAGQKLAFTIGFHYTSGNAYFESGSEGSLERLLAPGWKGVISSISSPSATTRVEGDYFYLNNSSGTARTVFTLAGDYMLSRIVIYAQGNSSVNKDHNATMVEALIGSNVSIGNVEIPDGSGDTFYEISYTPEEAAMINKFTLTSRGCCKVSRIEVYEEAEDGAEPIEEPEVSAEATPDYIENNQSTVETAGTLVSVVPADDGTVLYKLYFNDDQQQSISLGNNSFLIRPGEFEGVNIEPGELYYPVVVAYREGEEGNEKEVRLDGVLTQPGMEKESLPSSAVKLTLRVTNPDAHIYYDRLNDDPQSYEGPVELLKDELIRYWCTLEAEETTRAVQTYTSPKVYYKNGETMTSVGALTRDARIEYYDLQGRRMTGRPLAPGLYIRLEGTTPGKHLVR